MRILTTTFAIFLFSTLSMAQTAPQRSDELCSTLKTWASENGRKFVVSRPGACTVNIDTGYDFFIDYDPTHLLVGLGMNPILLNGDAGAFWLRLSAFDNLAHSALGTESQGVFDEMNKLAKRLAQTELEAMKKGNPIDLMLNSKTNRAYIAAMHDKKTGIATFTATATPSDIEKMKNQTKSPDGISGWRRVLSQSLLAFSAGATAYGNSQGTAAAYPVYNSTVTCYTNFLGQTMVTNCH